jgi:hypothetical protein
MIQLSKIARKIQKLLYREQWSLLVCDLNGKPLANIAPPVDRIWADPFPVELDGAYYVFVEQQLRGQNGTLGYIRLYDDLSFSDFHPVLEKDYHLSFPHVFTTEENGAESWYMIPESNENGRISLYRASRFPDSWEFVRDIIADARAVDSAILEKDGRFWLFTSRQTDATSLNDSLFIYYSDSLASGEWKPHAKNPVIVGRGFSRMAGRIFRDSDGSLVRPAQSCVREYGERTVLRRIVSLTETDYGEETIATISPEREYSAVCTHTYNRCGKYLLRDVKTRVFSPFHLLTDGRTHR